MPAVLKPSSDCDEAITVYVTGFGPFRSYSQNPSWEIVSSFLPTTHITTPTHTIAIIPHPTWVKVAYETIDTLIPQLHAEKKFDYILHVGVGLPGVYEAEMIAHEKGYIKADVDGLIPGGLPADPEEEMKEKERRGAAATAAAKKGGKTGEYVLERDGGMVYKTALDVKGICASVDACGILPKETPGAPLGISTSSDAGRYMCEYIFRTSMQCAAESDRRVLFLHVPPVNLPYTVETGKLLLEKFIVGFVAEGERVKRKRESEL